MNPFSAVFAGAVWTRNQLYDRGFLRSEPLDRPVISVGNLSVGGSGKTPFVILLGELLQARQIPFDILTRGYKRRSSGIKLVEVNGSAAEFGDEPLLMAEKLRVPVIVGEDRAAAGRFAEKMFSELRPAHGDHWFHLLDDGFQHRRLVRDFDIVMVSAEDLDDRLLPAGRLREPLAALQRADAIVVQENFPAARLGAFGKPIWTVRRRLEFERDKLPGRPIVVCGIAKPERFLKDLEQAGIVPVHVARFPDHHAYTQSDIDQLLRLRSAHDSGGFLTTEKDAVNLRPHGATLQPLVPIPLKMDLLDAEGALDRVLATIRGKER